MQWETIRHFKQLTLRMSQAEGNRLKVESSVEDSDTTMKPRWDNLPYPVIHNIAKLDLLIIWYAPYDIGQISYRRTYLDKNN